MPPRNLTIQQAADDLCCSVDQIRRHIRSGELVAFDIGQGSSRRKQVVTGESIAEFIERRTVHRETVRTSPRRPKKSWKFVT